MSGVNETSLTRVGVVGATGKMGRLACAAIVDDPELEPVAAIGRSKVGSSVEAIIGRNGVGVTICDGLDALIDAGVEVAVDFTHPSIGMHNARWYLNQGLHADSEQTEPRRRSSPDTRSCRTSRRGHY